jgi:hypothetical protein
MTNERERKFLDPRDLFHKLWLYLGVTMSVRDDQRDNIKEEILFFNNNSISSRTETIAPSYARIFDFPDFHQIIDVTWCDRVGLRRDRVILEEEDLFFNFDSLIISNGPSHTKI